MYSSEGNKPQYDDIPLQLKSGETNLITWELTGKIECDYTQEGGAIKSVEYEELTPKILANQYF
jgi:hypothetical protein